MSINNSLIILGMPRSGTSLVANLCIDSGYNPKISPDSKFFGGSPFNKGGYYEEVRLTLLNDQLIRLKYGNSYSFLFPPSIKKNFQPINLNKDFSYDITETTLDIPIDFTKNLKKYTGTETDIWGLSRMDREGRWYKAYEKFGVNNVNGISEYINYYSSTLSKKRNLIIKDPRLCFTLLDYNLKNIKILIVKRSMKKVVASLKRHYGPNFLTNKTFDGFSWNSNHFNLKVSPIEESKFQKNYLDNIKAIKENYTYIHEVSYEKLLMLDKLHIKELEGFIGKKVNTELIQK